MSIIGNEGINKEQAVRSVAEFLRLPHVDGGSTDAKEQIKRLCVLRLMKAVGVDGKFNCKSDFFEFFATIMGEAVCERLNLKIRIAPDEVRLIKYENVNFVAAFKEYLDNEFLDEAFLDAFLLVDKHKDLILQIMKKV